MNFVKPAPTTRSMSYTKIKALWEELKNKILFLPEDDANKVNLELINKHLYEVHSGAFANVIVPNLNPEFEKKCSEYKDDWAAHQSNVINTSKTFTVIYPKLIHNPLHKG